VWLKLPSTAPSATTTSTAFYRDDVSGQMKPYGTPAEARLDIAENEQSARDTALAALGRVGASGTSLQKIKADVAATALSTSDTNVIWSRLRALVDDLGTLERSGWTNAGAARNAVARLVTYVEFDYYRAGGN
jgi:hypothetical protein